MIHKTHITLEDTKAWEALQIFKEWYNERVEHAISKKSTQQIIAMLAIDFAELHIYDLLKDKGYSWNQETNKWGKE